MHGQWQIRQHANQEGIGAVREVGEECVNEDVAKIGRVVPESGHVTARPRRTSRRSQGGRRATTTRVKSRECVRATYLEIPGERWRHSEGVTFSDTLSRRIDARRLYPL